MTSYETLRVEPAPGTTPDEGVRCLVLNRPEVMNAMNTQMFVELRAALHDLAYDDGLRVLVVTGAGERAFSTGGDLKQRDGMTDHQWRRQHQLAEEVLLAVKDFPCPVIAAVEGHAHGGGCELALMCDWIVAARSAVFSLPEVRRGIMPGGGGIQNLVRAAGARRAKQLLLTARRFGAEQAAQWNIVTTLVDAGQALATAAAEAREVALAAPMAVHYAKVAASRGGEIDFHSGYALDIAAYNVLVSSQDRLEGVRAFNEAAAALERALMFKKVLIGNRGEIACRIARTCRRLGIAPVGVHSSADRDALHTSAMDTSIGLGGASAAESYLRIDAVIDAARRTGAEAIHPGYGFLAENPAFAEAVEAAGLVFIGPTADTLRRLGHKGQAKAEARAAGVPVLGGGEDASADAETVAERARSVTLPVLLKPAAGGGGKGMHVVRQASELPAAIGTAMREARSAFGDAALIVEPYVERGRHVEVQIAGDGRGEVIHLFERECTLQRRHQKLIEEAPAALLPQGLRERLLDDALRIARRFHYRGVGTVEFLVAGDRHWFLEVNPRLQVEHPVTEEVTGIDIVELMLRVAAGLGLPLRQADVRVRGHAVEARLCAEDAERDFLPATGSIEQIAFPGGGVRVESGVRAGSEVTPHYDSLLAKLVVHAATRDEALDRVQAALAETRVLGVTTNADFLRRLLARAEVRDASFHTRSIDEWLARPDRTAQAVPPAIVAAAGLWWMFDERARAPDCGSWSAADVTGWQMHAGDDPLSAVPAVLLRDGATVHEVHLGIPGPDGFTTVQVGDTRLRLALRAQPGGGWQCEQGGEVRPLALARRGTSLFVQAGGTGHLLEVLPYLARAAAGSAGSGELRTPMMGTILATHAEVGQALRAGDVVVTMESMKMEMKICAEHDGVLASLSAVAGQTVERGRVVAVVAAADAPDTAPADAAT